MSNLGVLRSDNIVRRKREGKHIVYSLADQQVLDLMVRGKFGGEKRPAAIRLTNSREMNKRGAADNADRQDQTVIALVEKR
jgi:hypothetical protein